MLTKQEAEEFCRVGPGTPVGTALRRYWFPAFLLSDLPENDGTPIGVTVLGQNFVAFRDSNGRVGFLDELCCHRGASLTYGRVEECGIRCIYHGWKFDVEGTVLETPNFADDNFKSRIRQGSYPVREAGGLGWVYLGPADLEPDFPRYPWMGQPEDEFVASEVLYDCNWVQVQEGSLDSSHVGILHMDNGTVMRPLPRMIGSLEFGGLRWDDQVRPPHYAPGAGMPTDDNAPLIEVEDTPFGFQYAAIRTMPESSEQYVRITSLSFPYIAHVGSSNSAVIVIPRDDETCSTINVRALSAANRRGAASAPNEARTRFPSDGRRYTVQPQDREAMRAGTSFAGFKDGNRPQDASVQGVNGKLPIYSRETEHLVPADAAILRFRNMLLEAARSVEEGEAPPGLGSGYDYTKLQAATGVIPETARWQDLVPGNEGK